MAQWRIRTGDAGGDVDAPGTSARRLRLVLVGELVIGDVDAVLAQLDRLGAGSEVDSVESLECDVRGVAPANLGTIDALARLQLGARRRGCELTLWGVRHDLRRLIRSAGLVEQLPERDGWVQG